MSTKHFTKPVTWASCTLVALAMLLALPPGAHAQGAAKTFVMKLSTATINDTQHEWLRRFVAAVEKDSDGRIKGEIYPASQLGSIPRRSRAFSSARSRPGSAHRNFWSAWTSAMKR